MEQHKAAPISADRAASVLLRRSVLIAGLGLALPAGAQTDWPARPVRVVVPYATGGAPDLLARLFAQDLSSSLGVPVVVDNRAGQGGSVGADHVAKQPPDGYTLLLTTTATHAINPALYPGLPYDPLRDFTPIALVARTPLLMAVSPQLPVRDLASFLAYARARPGELSFASAGAGTMQHITAELFMSRTGVRMEHVPYRGSGQITTDMLAGRVQVMFNSVAPFLPLVRDGKLRAIGMTTTARSPAAPEIPTLAEAGLEGFEASAWYAVYGPANLPVPIVARVAAALRAALATPRVRERYGSLGLDAEFLPADELAALTRRDLEIWTRVIRANDIRAE